MTPADVTAISVNRDDDGLWWIIVEQGNGDVIKDIKLTDMERMQLACMIDPCLPSRETDVCFVDLDRTV